MQTNQSSDYGSGIFEFELFRLNRLLEKLEPVGSILESKEIDTEELTGAMKNIALVLNPDIDTETLEAADSAPMIAIGLAQALELSHRLIAAWKVTQNVDREPMDRLLESAQTATQSPPDCEKIVENIPWMLGEGLAWVCQAEQISREPSSKVAVGARILSCLYNAVTQVPGMANEPPEEPDSGDSQSTVKESKTAAEI